MGKTALLREVLGGSGRDRFHVLHFDLRIPGFADLEGLYGSLSRQMEWYFSVVAEEDGYEDFEREAWAFKVRLSLLSFDTAPKAFSSTID